MEKRFGFRLDEDDVLEGPLVEWLNGLSRFRRGEWIRRQLIAAYYSTEHQRPAREARAPRPDQAKPRRRVRQGAVADAAAGAASSSSTSLSTGPAPVTSQIAESAPEGPTCAAGEKLFGHLKGVIRSE